MRELFAVMAAFVMASAPCWSEEKPKLDPRIAELAGSWKIVSTSGNGKVVTAAGNKDEFGRLLWNDSRFTITGDQLKTTNEPVVLPNPRADVGLFFAIYAGTEFRLKMVKAEGKGPREIDLTLKNGVVLKGIYELKGDDLKLCLVNWLSLPSDDDKKMKEAADAIVRPTVFHSNDALSVCYVLKREK